VYVYACMCGYGRVRARCMASLSVQGLVGVPVYGDQAQRCTRMGVSRRPGCVYARMAECYGRVMAKLSLPDVKGWGSASATARGEE